MSVEPQEPAGPSPRRNVPSLNLSGLRWLVLVVVVGLGAFLLSQAFGAGSGQATSPSPSASSNHSPTPTPSATGTPDLANTTVAVYNSTSTPNLAGGEQQKLQSAGFNVVTIGNVHPALAKTTVYYTEAGKAVAQYLQQTQYPTADLKLAPTGTTEATTDVAVVLGTDFTG